MYIIENLGSALAATIVGVVIGGLWYSPLMFMKPWLQLAFKGNAPSDAERKKEMPKAMFGMFIVLLFKICVLGTLLQILGVNDALSGAQYGLWLWVGFIATSLMDGVLFEQRPLKLYAINAGYHLVSMIVMGAILASF